MTPDEIETLVSQEVARLKAQDLIGARSRLSEMFAHPFVLTIAGFIFTFGITTWIENALSERADARDRLEATLSEIDRDAEARRASLMAIDQLARERIVAGDMLRSALGRGATEEIAPRKATYDDVFIRWNERLNVNLLTLAQIETQSVSGSGEGHYTSAIEGHVQRLFPVIDGCLTMQYDIAMDRPGAGWRCPTRTLDGATATWKGALKSRSDAVTSCLDAILAAGLEDIALMAQADRRAALNRAGPTAASPAPTLDAACPDMRGAP